MNALRPPPSNWRSKGKKSISTVHATTCAGVPPRLVDLGIPPQLIGFRDFFAGCVSQSLVPVLCPECAYEQHPEADTEAHYRELFDGAPLRYQRDDGCTACDSTGVVGQTLVAEVYPLVRTPRPADEPYRLIREADYSGLVRYMSEEMDVQSKHEMAADKIVRGVICPLTTEDRIGYYTPGTPWGREALARTADQNLSLVQHGRG